MHGSNDTDKPIILHRVNNACKSIIVVKHQEQNIYYEEDYLLISQSSMLKAKKDVVLVKQNLSVKLYNQQQ